MLNELNADNLKEILEQNEKVIVQFGASWCGACKIVKPQFKELAEKYSDLTFYYVDAEEYPESRELCEVENLPTFASFKSGQLVKKMAGSKIACAQEVIDEITSH